MRDALGEIFELRDVQNRAAGKVLGESVRVRVDAHLDRVLADKGHIVVRNIVVRAIRKTDAERSERSGLEQFAYLFGRNHRNRVSDGGRCFNLILP